MTDKSKTKQIGIVGGTQSGKTLYLSCLPKFIQKNKVLLRLGVNFQGADSKSVNWLSTMRNKLDNCEVPTGTTKEEELNFYLSVNNLRGAINIIDRSGYDYQNYLAVDLSTLIDKLSLCTGFIILVDPTTPLNEQSNYFRPLFEHLYNGIIDKGNSLNKRFSICLTKTDDPKFWDWYQDLEKQYLSWKGVPDEKRFKFVFKEWAKKNGGEDFTTNLENQFNNQVYKNFQYYLISSIGFFEDNGTKLTNLVTLLNYKGEEEPRLRNGMDYSPVNLFDPLYWAMGGKTRSCQ